MRLKLVHWTPDPAQVHEEPPAKHKQGHGVLTVPSHHLSCFLGKKTLTISSHPHSLISYIKCEIKARIVYNNFGEIIK